MLFVSVLTDRAYILQAQEFQFNKHILAPDVLGSGEGVGESGQPPGSPDGADHRPEGPSPSQGGKNGQG